MNKYLTTQWRHVDKLNQEATRDGFGKGLVEAAEENDQLYTICADLTESTRVHWFKEKFPERFIQLGVAEQALAAIAGGLGLAGKTTFIASYASFSPGRNWEQIKTTGCLQKVPMKVAGCHAGISVGPDGATHQMLEDIALMRVLPEMTVLAPCDANEAHRATVAMAKLKGPAYIRLARAATPVFTKKSMPFEVGKAYTLVPGDDLAIFACGPLVYEALQAHLLLKTKGISARVINVSSIKPLDEKTILSAARECGVALTLEEGQIAGGMGSAICEFLCESHPIPVLRMGMQDRYGETGDPHDLLEHFKLTAPHITRNAQSVLKKKRHN